MRFKRWALEIGPMRKVGTKAESLSSKPAIKASFGSISMHAAAITRALSLIPIFPGAIASMKLKLVTE